MSWRDQLIAEHQQRRDDHLWRNRYELSSPQTVEITRNGRQFLNFCSNDYLGLASHPDLAAASAEAAQNWGTGSGASHLVCGHQTPHHALEQELAEFVGAQDALLFSTGYMANLAIPAAFLGRGDLLLQDKLNHASLIDAAALTRADFKRYKHCDVMHAETLLSAQGNCRRILGTDSVFSMDGDLAPLEALHQLCEKEDVLFVVDDAHGFGVLGENGRGALSHVGIKPAENVLMMGTLGKAAGSFGAFVAGDKLLIDHLKQHARTYIYTTALPAAVVEASREALKRVAKDAWRRETLETLIKEFRSVALQKGLQLTESSTPIQPVIIGSEKHALAASQHLENNGIWVPAIRPPTVPKGTARLRICLSSNHSINHINQLIESLLSCNLKGME